MNKTLSILFGGALLCIFSAESCATKQIESDPVKIAAKALNLPGFEGYREGQKQKLCIVFANPTQEKWRQQSEELSKKYNLTFIDYCGSGTPCGMARGQVFDEEIEKMGYKLIGVYDSTRHAGLSYPGSSESISDLLIMSSSGERYLAVYKKKGGNTIVIRTNVRSEVFQRYVTEHLVAKFDAIIQDKGALTGLTESLTANLMKTLKRYGVFLSCAYSSEDYSAPNPWKSFIDKLPSSSPWKKSKENGAWSISSGDQNFGLRIRNEFTASWDYSPGCCADYTAACKIEGDLVKELFEPVLGKGADYNNPRFMIARFGTIVDSPDTNDDLYRMQPPIEHPAPFLIEESSEEEEKE